MEKHFLADFVSGVQRETPRPWLNIHGDCIVCQLDVDTAVFAERIDELLSIYRSAETRKAVGFQIKGVRAITERFGWDAMAIQAEANGSELRSVSMTALCLAAYENGPKTISRRRGYAEAITSCAGDREVAVDERELCYA